MGIDRRARWSKVLARLTLGFRNLGNQWVPVKLETCSDSVSISKIGQLTPLFFVTVMSESHDMLKSKRATRGLRMADLVGEAADEDETFWTHDTWAEGSDDDEFSEEEVKPDVYDSDFNDTESDSDSEEDSDEEVLRKTEKKTKTKESVAGNRYKEPGVIAPKQKVAAPKTTTGGDGIGGGSSSSSSASMTPRPMKRSSSSTSVGSTDTPRSLRGSTKEKSDVAESERKRLKTQSDSKRLSRPVQVVVRQTFTQKELLLDALETEEKNLQWLSGQRYNNDSRLDAEKPVRKGRAEGCIRKLSRRGTYDTVTFTNVDNMPSVFNLAEPELPVKSRCVVTGSLAKYFDPLTGQPYAHAEAFKVLRARHKISIEAR